MHVKRVDAIKWVRENPDKVRDALCGLREAKNLVEEILVAAGVGHFDYEPCPTCNAKGTTGNKTYVPPPTKF